MQEHGLEPVPGLPERLPNGERILWQGAPDWRRFAVSALHVRTVGAYFVGLMAWQGALVLWDHRAPADALSNALLLGALGLASLLILFVLAWLIGRSTVYTVTQRRVVMRFGVALPMTVNLPFAGIEAAGAKLGSDGSGDIVLVPSANTQLNYALLWPHVRPWHMLRSQPMLRSVKDAAGVARILGEAMAAAAKTEPAAPVIVPPAAPPRRGIRPAAAPA